VRGSYAINFSPLHFLEEAAHKKRCKFIAHRNHNSIAGFAGDDDQRFVVLLLPLRPDPDNEPAGV